MVEQTVTPNTAAPDQMTDPTTAAALTTSTSATTENIAPRTPAPTPTTSTTTVSTTTTSSPDIKTTATTTTTPATTTGTTTPTPTTKQTLETSSSKKASAIPIADSSAENSMNISTEIKDDVKTAKMTGAQIPSSNDTTDPKPLTTPAPSIAESLVQTATASSINESPSSPSNPPITRPPLNGIEHINSIFTTASTESRLIFSAFIPGGYPTLGSTADILLNLQSNGVELIELGIPFSDPVADGRTIQLASNKALKNGSSVTTCFASVKRARALGLTSGVIIMTYWNPLIAYGLSSLCSDARESGVDGILVVDLPADEAIAPLPEFFLSSDISKSKDNEECKNKTPSFVDLCVKEGLTFIPLMAPTTPPHRAEKIVSVASSFVYCVSLTGVTGALNFDDWNARARQGIKSMVDCIHQTQASKVRNPFLLVGFGIASREQVDTLAKIAGVDGFVVGSCLIDRIESKLKKYSSNADASAPSQIRKLVSNYFKSSHKSAEGSGMSSDPLLKAVSKELTELCNLLKGPSGKILKSLSSEDNNNNDEDGSNSRPQQYSNKPADVSTVSVNNIQTSDISCGDRFFGPFGGRFVPETLMFAHEVLENEFNLCIKDPEFAKEFAFYRTNYIGGPTPIHKATRLTQHLGGAQIYFKREELAFTGAHKINNAIGQALLAKRLGKTRIIAETGAGQHGVATATACALLGLQCIVYMGAVDIERQKLNVFRMKVLGAEVRSVTSGTETLKDAVNEALRDWVSNIDTTHYLIGSVIGPHPFPHIVRFFQSVIGKESRAQMLLEGEFSKAAVGPGRLPDVVIACVGGGSNAIGMFSAFLGDASVRLVGVEGGGRFDSLSNGIGTSPRVPTGPRSSSDKEEEGDEGEGLKKGVPSSSPKGSVDKEDKRPDSADDDLNNNNNINIVKDSKGGAKQTSSTKRTVKRHSSPNVHHCASLSGGVPGVFHGTRTYVLQDKNGQISETSSISAGLDYPGVGPELASLKESKRAEFVWVSDKEALEALQLVSTLEGIIPALEPSHALAYAMQLSRTMGPDKILLVNLCGRGDKDMSTIASALGVTV